MWPVLRHYRWLAPQCRRYVPETRPLCRQTDAFLPDVVSLLTTNLEAIARKTCKTASGFLLSQSPSDRFDNFENSESAWESWDENHWSYLCDDSVSPLSPFYSIFYTYFVEDANCILRLWRVRNYRTRLMFKWMNLRTISFSLIEMRYCLGVGFRME